jgi:general secretion pathway protein D
MNIRLRSSALALALALALTVPNAISQPDLQTLNLKETDITVLIGMVGEITGKTFIVDPRVTGPVTVIAQKPMNAAEVYDVFLSVLRVHGFAAVPTGNVIKIVPDATARQDIDANAESGSGNPDELVTRVIELKQVQANELVPIIKPMLPPQAQVAVHAGSNALLISDRLGNIERISAIIRRIDQRSDSSVDVLPLNYASAGELQRTLNALMPGEAGSARVIADARTNSLLLSGDPTTRLKLRAMVAHLDTPLKQGDNTQVVYLKYADAKSLVPLLNQVAQSLTFEQPNPDPKKTGGSAATIQAHEPTNSLIVSGPNAVLRQLTQVIDRLDVRPAQILIEAIVAEVSLDKASEIGVQWQAADSNLNNGGLIGGSQFSGPNGTGGINQTAGGLTVNPFGALAALGGGLNLGYLDGFTTIRGADGEDITVPQLGALAKALRADANTNVLSTPSVLTLDHKQAKILVGQEVPFLTGQYAQTGGAVTTGGSGQTGTSVNPFQTIQRNNVGLTLTVTPHVNQGDTVLLDIKQEVSSVAPSSSGAVDLITNKREVNTTVMVADGKTLVLGGLIDEDTSETVQKVPALGDIPLLGNLFKYRSTKRVQRNLMIFIRPTILADVAAQDAITAEKYNYIRDKQAQQRERQPSTRSAEDLPLMPDIFDLDPAPKRD